MLQARPFARPRASTRVRAALAGGLVLGLGAGLTVASWTDAEFVKGTFTASAFDLQTSLQGGAYTSATTVSATVNGLYPGAVAYVSLRIKTAAVSTAGSVSLSAAANAGAGLAPVLRYRIVQTAASCASSVFTAGATYAAGSFTTYQPLNAALAPTASVAVAANAGSEAAYCVELGLPATGVAQATYQGTSATATWLVSGTSS